MKVIKMGSMVVLITAIPWLGCIGLAAMGLDIDVAAILAIVGSMLSILAAGALLMVVEDM